MHDVVFFSQALQRNMQYRVFLPQAAGNQKLPVVYLLHGGGGYGFRDWSNDSDVARFASQGLALVMPEAGYSYYTNAAQRPQDRYEDYIMADLQADVEQRFPVRSDRGGRAIIGVSMGGFGALKLALHHPEQFAFAGALSPAIDAPRRRFTWRRVDQSRHFQEIFGPEDSPLRHDNDPFFLVNGADAAKTPYFYMTCGKQEGLLAPVREFSDLLDCYHIAHEFHTVPGGHDWNNWNSQLPGVFGSLTGHLDKPDATSYLHKTTH
jgi:S-formylglutathione hydrolase FrmB